MVVDQHFGQDLQPGGEPLSGFGLEACRDAPVVRAPDHGAGLGRGDAVGAALLHQVEVAVARVVDLDLRNLGADPQRQGKPLVERPLDELLEFAQKQKEKKNKFTKSASR